MNSFLRHISRIGIAGMLTAATSCAFSTIESNEIGVLVNNAPFPPTFKQGVAREPLRTGRHFYIPLLQDVVVLNGSLRTISVNDAGSQNKGTLKELRLRTKEGNDIYAAINITYRIDEATAYALVRNVSGIKDIEAKILLPAARSACRTSFGQLSTTEFSLPTSRRAKASASIRLINHKLERLGLLVTDINIVSFHFNPDYERKVREKETYNQEAEMNAYLQKTVLATTEAHKKEAEGLSRKLAEEASGYQRIMAVRGESERYAKQRLADATKISGVARAEGMRAVGRALDGKGGANLVSYETAKILQGKEIILLPLKDGGGLQYTNVNELITRLLVSERAEKQAQATAQTTPPAPAESQVVVTPAVTPAQPPKAPSTVANTQAPQSAARSLHP